MAEEKLRRRMIVIEGLDGSGKATQAELLSARMEQAGLPARKVTFPNYESKSSALVQMYLAGEIGGVDEVNAYAASGFYAADRYISYMTEWKTDYEAGHTILADRYTTSNAVHQMAKLPEDEWDSYLEWLWDNEFEKMKLPAPDLVIYLDIPTEVSQQLLRERYGGDTAKKDIHERDEAYLRRCRKAALFASDKLGWHVLDCCAGGELWTREAVAEAVWVVVEEDREQNRR